MIKNTEELLKREAFEHVALKALRRASKRGDDSLVDFAREIVALRAAEQGDGDEYSKNCVECGKPEISFRVPTGYLCVDCSRNMAVIAKYAAFTPTKEVRDE